MDLQDIVKNIIKSGKTELFAQPGKFLEEIRKQCRSETDAVMYIQFRILLDLNRNFVNALYLSAKDGSYCGAVEKLSAFYDGKKIPARVYAYFIYAVLNGCGVATDKAEWFDPLTDIFFRPFCNSPARGARPAVNALCSDCDMQIFSGNGHRDVPHELLDRGTDIEWLWEETSRRVGL